MPVSLPRLEAVPKKPFYLQPSLDHLVNICVLLLNRAQNLLHRFTYFVAVRAF